MSAAQGSPGELDVYPVRVNHKMGYVKFYPYGSETVIIDTVIPPKYDYIGDINLPYNNIAAGEGAPSPYRMFELDEKVGLLGPSLDIVLPNDYKRIRVVTDDLMAVEQDSLFMLIDTSGRVYLDSFLYQDICLAEPGGQRCFFVKNEKGWGLRRQSGSPLVDCSYSDIRQAGMPGYYKVKKRLNDKQWELIDSSGRQVLKNAYDDILVLDANFIALLEGLDWQLIHRPKGATGGRGSFAAFDSPGGKYEIIEKANSRLAVLVPRGDEPLVELWDITKQKRLVKNEARKRPVEGVEQPPGRRKTYLPWYFPIAGEEGFAICNADVNRAGQVDYLIDSAGALISLPYAHIEPSGKACIFRVSRRGKWGLLAPLLDSLPVTDCGYDGLALFQDNIAVTRLGGAYGAIVATENGLDSLSCIYDNLTLQGEGRLKVRMGGRQIADYRLDSLGRPALDTVYAGLYIAEDAERLLREARPANVRAGQGYEPKTHNWGRLFVTGEPNALLINKMGLVKEGPFGREAEKKLWSDPLPFDEKPIGIRELVEDSILLFTHRNRPVNTPFTRMFFARPAAGKAFYSLSRRADISRDTILGIRDFDYNYTYTAFIDQHGKMGLINTFGEQLAKGGRPLRFTYIGPFRAGLARVCIGGALFLYKKEAKHDEPAKFRLAHQWAFARDFNINTLGASPDALQDGEIYALGSPENPCRWAYIDTAGNIVLEPEADFVEDFQEEAGFDFALVLERSAGGTDVYGRPDADYGLIDKRGKLLIEPAYDDIRAFPDHFSVSKRGTPVFFFSSKGHELFINRTRLRPFSEGMAHFYDEQKRWGYVDTLGQVAIPPRFLKARPFSEGLAAVVDSSGYCAFIDKRGDIAFRTALPSAGWPFLGNFKGGRCWFKGEGKKWGCYNRRGEVAIPPVFYVDHEAFQGLKPDSQDSVLQTLFSLQMDFSRGLASVKTIEPGGSARPAVIDTAGQRINLPGQYGQIGPFDAHGLAVVSSLETGLKGLINAEGAALIEPQYQSIEGFINGFARVQAQNGRWGLADRAGRLVVPTQYAEVDTLSEGLLAVRPAGKPYWMFIDTANQVQIKGPFQQTQPFKRGHSLVVEDNQNRAVNRFGEPVFIKNDTILFYSEGIFGMKEALPESLAANGQPGRKSQKETPGRYYYADASGNNLFGRYFESISPFEAGIATVRPMAAGRGGDSRFGAINRRGVMAVPPKYSFVKRQEDGNIGANPQQFYGLAAKSGKLLLAAEYDRIEQFGEHDLYRVERGEKIGYLMKRGEEMVWVWPLQK